MTPVTTPTDGATGVPLSASVMTGAKAQIGRPPDQDEGDAEPQSEGGRCCPLHAVGGGLFGWHVLDPDFAIGARCDRP